MKKTILITAILMPAFASAQTISLRVNMEGFKSNKGKVQVGLYNAEGTFLKSTFKSVASIIKDQKATVVFEGLEKGEYAVSIYQDENENGVMDTNMFGIPKEDYASSNNAKGSMVPPKYKDAKFALIKDETIEINLGNR
jgi:uncharacterized protein (DUF2141 family)